MNLNLALRLQLLTPSEWMQMVELVIFLGFKYWRCFFLTKREMMTLLKVSYMLIKSIRNIRWGFIYQNEGLNYFYKMTRCKLELENSYKHSNMIQQTSIEQTLKIMIYWALFLNNHSLSIWEKIMNISFHLLMIFSAISIQFSLDYKRILNINQIDPNLILFNTPCGIRIEK